MLKNQKKPQKKQKTTFYLSKIKLDFPPAPEKTQQQQLKYL